MRVLVLGGGGREHALVWMIARSPRCTAVWCAPGNAGIAELATCLPIDPSDSAAVLAAVRSIGADLVVIGPEAPLVAGVADDLRAAGVAVFGPGADGAILEGSKAWSKAFMDRHGVPTAAARVFEDGAGLLEHLATCPIPTVVKADGLAAGKGVTVAMTREQALDAGRELVDGRFGEAGARVVVEEFLDGEEATVFALLDGQGAVVLQACQDHKRRFDGDEGPNTGGMGAYTPVPAVDEALLAHVRRDILDPVVAGLAAEGIDYRGVLYVGLMLTAAGPRVVEFNVRFGDPECQPLVMALESDLLPLLDAAARGDLGSVPAPRFFDGATLCVVLVAGGYPGDYDKGLPIDGLDAVPEDRDLAVFHAGTKRDGERIVTAGGRVLGITARGATVREARDAAYAAARKIRWDAVDMRTDIAGRALARET